MEFQLKKDINYRLGIQYVAEGKFEDAVDTFSGLLQASCAKFGDDSIQVAPVWFEYGNALLSKEEDSPTDDLLGKSAADEVKKQIKETIEDIKEDDDENNDEDDDDLPNSRNEESNTEPISSSAGTKENDGDEEEKGDEEASDMEIAWEALEVARTILEKHADSDTDMMLAEVHSRLGDLQRFNGSFDAAINEYKKSLDILECICSDTDRLLSTAHYNIAAAHIYNAAEEGKDAMEEKKKALDHYRKSKKVITAILSQNHNMASNTVASSTSSSLTTSNNIDDVKKITSQDIESFERISEELTETIEELELDINGAYNCSSSDSNTGVTTIGFGSGKTSSTSSSGATGFGKTSSSSSFPSSFERISSSSTTSKPTASAAVTSIFASSSSSGVSSSGVSGQGVSSTASVLQVRKKVKPVSVANTNVSEPASGQKDSKGDHATDIAVGIKREREEEKAGGP
mmetsp:Transcript_37344/g.38024  ORF Transcript_37344/g.38024 Transcript_37344/m.38024 type:complete len:459 (+) Transcript_37344:38-1414(+)